MRFRQNIKKNSFATGEERMTQRHWSPIWQPWERWRRTICIWRGQRNRRDASGGGKNRLGQKSLNQVHSCRSKKRSSIKTAGASKQHDHLVSQGSHRQECLDESGHLWLPGWELQLQVKQELTWCKGLEKFSNVVETKYMHWQWYLEIISSIHLGCIHALYCNR